jgi:hypothetical protein
MKVEHEMRKIFLCVRHQETVNQSRDTLPAYQRQRVAA